MSRPVAMLRSTVRLAILLLAAILPGAAGPVAAQLSPGPLSEPHAELEGSGHCLECHSSGRGVDPERCLTCHEPLAARIAAGRGLHARADYADCETCHIEHHGREFELVWWGESGRDSFDHAVTGFSLVGRHAELDCRDCHRAELNREASVLAAHGKDLGETFLGLGTDCLSCHRDEHRGQFAAEACLGCHSQTAWTPAAAFDHDEARFALTGRHRQVACEECHRSVEEPLAAKAEERVDPSFRRFRGLAFERCSDCHRDPHEGRFGADCSSCHSTERWQAIDDQRFDHDLTRYPLEGLHRRVDCETCHRPGQPRRGLAHASCTDCHRDEHAGQLAERPDGGRCESCHTVEGFVPALFDRDDHRPVFALEGAHRRLECEACHRREPAGELVRQGVVEAAAARGRDAILRLRMPASLCTDCHADPHAGSATAIAGWSCQTCHVEETWQAVTFDHATTGFELVGPHARPTCRQCHAPEAPEASTELGFAGLGTDCTACHRDPHRGQFASAEGGVDCLRCHTSERWQPAERFDHARDAAFPLEGAHARLECSACHREERDEIDTWVHYRPLGQRCIDCHGGA